MNTITIKNWDDFVKKQNTILLHGKEYNKGLQFYKELSPCVVEINTNCIRDIAHKFFDSRNPWNSLDGGDFSRFETVMNHVIYGKEDFTDIPGSEYIGSDYYRVYRCFSFYKHEKNAGILTRRQFSYCFDEKLCMNGMQIFEDEKLMILNFRSCDYVKKFPLDLFFIKILLDDFNVNIDKIYCIFGSLHIYKGEKI